VKANKLVRLVSQALVRIGASYVATLGIDTTAQAVALSDMGPIAQYLMSDRNAEIALARSAAPASISGKATVLVLTSRGYEKAVEGSNGFVCIVERSWMSPSGSDEFWNPKVRGPICFNAPAVRSVLPITYKRSELALSGTPKTQLLGKMKDAAEKKQLPTIETGAMSYMMSKSGYLGDSVGHWHPHLMFYGPSSDGTDWGADQPGSPILMNPQFQDGPESLTTVMVQVPRWSDGTLGSAMGHSNDTSSGAKNH
jgi:hypothetical protein